MFFMFHILVLTIYFCVKSSTARSEDSLNLSDYFEGNAEIFGIQRNNKDDTGNLKHDLTTQNSLPHIVKNLAQNQSNNLKTNVFDKMLSDEMLSIQQRFFEKDLAYNSNVQNVKKVTKSNGATPTLEVKQKWPVVDEFTKSLNTKDFRDPTEKYEIKLKSNLNRDEPIIKSLDIRSLSGHSGNSMHNSEIKCNCANANSNHQCKHGDDCTRKAPHGSTVGNSPYPALYVPYQAYFVSDNNENLFQNPLYHPQVINELKIPKTTRHRKPSNPRDDDLYYDDDWKKRRVPNDDDVIIMNIDYDADDKKPGISSNCIHEDLKEVYNKGVKRKCYCSMSQTTSSRGLILFMCVLVSLKYKVLFC